jgi:SAM-dependent methyltransferase
MPEVQGNENAQIAEFYDRRVTRFGVQPRALDWGSRASQETRFDVLVQIDDLSGCSVLDVGCGLADLFAFLRSRKIPASYTGYDIAPAVLESARARFPDAELRLADLMAQEIASPQFDFVFASGIFHLRPAGSYSYLEAMARRMYEGCRRGAAFNTLSAKSPKTDSHKFLAEPAKVLEICLNIAPKVVLRHDYMAHDFTVYLYKSGAPDPSDHGGTGVRRQPTAY